ncbi:hypothetical protein DFH06DRAFT_1136595 [Mycena polygramma]|nr:hypothetical protein DFH06DRAFT_1136595 [Mycena polygramma]
MKVGVSEGAGLDMGRCKLLGGDQYDGGNLIEGEIRKSGGVRTLVILCFATSSYLTGGTLDLRIFGCLPAIRGLRLLLTRTLILRGPNAETVEMYPGITTKLYFESGIWGPCHDCTKKPGVLAKIARSGIALSPSRLRSWACTEDTRVFIDGLGQIPGDRTILAASERLWASPFRARDAKDGKSVIGFLEVVMSDKVEHKNQAKIETTVTVMHLGLISGVGPLRHDRPGPALPGTHRADADTFSFSKHFDRSDSSYETLRISPNMLASETDAISVHSLTPRSSKAMAQNSGHSTFKKGGFNTAEETLLGLSFPTDTSHGAVTPMHGIVLDVNWWALWRDNRRACELIQRPRGATSPSPGGSNSRESGVSRRTNIKLWPLNYWMSERAMSIASHPYTYPVWGSSGSAQPQRSITMFNFPSTCFPVESIERYPCLTRALANNYPGPRYFFANDASMMSSSTLSSSVAPDSYFGYPNATNPTGNEVGFRSFVCENSQYGLNYIPILAQDHDVLRAEEPSTTLGACPTGASNYAPVVPAVGRTTAVESKETAKLGMKHYCPLCGQLFRRFVLSIRSPVTN